ncbi:MAG: hypothetical protein ACE5F1_21250 [Planctomycetota bacterium]
MTRETVVLVTLIAYKIVLITIGVLAQRRTRDGEDFFLGGRGLGPWVAAISAYRWPTRRHWRIESGSWLV